MKKNKVKEFDERQIQLQGKIFKHGFYLLFLLLMLNSLLPTWANDKFQGYLIAMLAVTVVHVILAVFGLIYGKKSKTKTILGMLAFGFIFIPYVLIRIVDSGQSFVEDGMLSNTGFGVVLLVVIIINAVCPLIQLARDKKANREEIGDET